MRASSPQPPTSAALIGSHQTIDDGCGEAGYNARRRTGCSGLCVDERRSHRCRDVHAASRILPTTIDMINAGRIEQ
jgi:hypothetical protein